MLVLHANLAAEEEQRVRLGPRGVANEELAGHCFLEVHEEQIGVFALRTHNLDIQGTLEMVSANRLTGGRQHRLRRRGRRTHRGRVKEDAIIFRKELVSLALALLFEHACHRVLIDSLRFLGLKHTRVQPSANYGRDKLGVLGMLVPLAACGLRQESHFLQGRDKLLAQLADILQRIV